MQALIETGAVLLELFPLTPDVELHASAIFNGNGEPWASLQRNIRIDILKRVYAYIADQSVCLFGVAMHKASFKSINPIQRTCEELSGHFDAALARLEADKGREKQLGLMIFDESNHARTLHVLLSQYRTTGARFGRVKHIAEVPMFADSKLTRVLQIADFVAYAIFRRYERGDSSFLDMIIHKFDEGQGRLHGLVHLIADYRFPRLKPGFLLLRPLADRHKHSARSLARGSGGWAHSSPAMAGVFCLRPHKFAFVTRFLYP